MLTRGDPTRTAVLALHYQNEVLHPDGAIRMGVADGDTQRASVLAAAGRLLAGARDLDIPLIHVRIAFAPGHEDVIANGPIFRNVIARKAMEEGSWGVRFYPGLEPHDSETVLTHNRVSAFHRTKLQTRLDELGVGHLVLAGVATHSVVETTFRHAADVGWLVTVAKDACSSGDQELHRASLTNMALLGEVDTVDALAARRFSPAHDEDGGS
ncbi:MAG: isochorismatase family cysteine hydrolase [Pseudomonadota bacterium]